MHAVLDAPDQPATAFGRVLRGCVGALFVVALYAPLVDLLVGGERADLVQAENRRAYTRPPLPRTLAQLETWPRRFSDYYQDSFGLRSQLIRLHNRLAWFGFGESPTDQLVLGTDDWVFHARRGAIESFRTLAPFKPQDLVAWGLMLEARRAWLAERNIEYLVVVVPSKVEVYGDLLPAAFQPRGEGRREPFLEYMAAHGDVRVLDLLPAMRAQRQLDSDQDHAYNKFGTHWSDRAAMAGYREIVGELARHWPDMRAWPQADFESRLGLDEHSDSWTQRLYLDDLLDEQFIVFEPRRPQPAQLDPPGSGNARQQHFLQPDAGLPRGLLLHDSFGRQLRPLLAQHFSSLWTNWSNDFDIELIERATPDVVIQVFVDKTLEFSSPALTDRVGGQLLRAAFDASRDVLLELGPEPFVRRLRPFGGTRLSWLEGAEGGVEIATSGGGDLFYLPAVEFPSDRGAVLELELTSPEAGNLAVLYRTAGEPDYDRERSYDVLLPAGRSQVHVHLAASDMQGRLLVRPASPGGRSVLHRAEIRAVTLP